MHPIEVGFRNKNILESQKCIVIFPLPAFVLLFLPWPLPPAPWFTIPAPLEWNPPTFVSRCSKYFQILSPGAANISKYCDQVLQILSSSLLDKLMFPPRCRPQWLGGCPPIKSVSLLAPQVSHFVKSFFFLLLSLSIQSSKSRKVLILAPQDLCLCSFF